MSSFARFVTGFSVALNALLGYSHCAGFSEGHPSSWVPASLWVLRVHWLTAAGLLLRVPVRPPWCPHQAHPVNLLHPILVSCCFIIYHLTKLCHFIQLVLMRFDWLSLAQFGFVHLGWILSCIRHVCHFWFLTIQTNFGPETWICLLFAIVQLSR